MEAPASSLTCSPAGIDGGAVSKEEEGALSQVDPFIVEALENPRHRLTVLRMELDIQNFMQNPNLYQFEFQHFPTSYLRRAAHRVAQHYGLQTMALDNIVDGLGSRVIARKTPESRYPAVCLSEVPAKHPEKERDEQVKIAIRQRPSKGLSTDAIELGVKINAARTVEERKEEYDKARSRIFNISSSADTEGLPSMPSADGRRLGSGGDEQECYRTIEDNDKISTKDGAFRVAIFRDREKDRSDPDYDRSYDRYVRGLIPNQTICLGGCTVLQPPFLQYETGFPQGQLLRNPASVSYRPSNLTVNPFCAFGSNQTSKEAVFMQWPSPAMLYAHSYEHFRHGVFQAPFYQQPLSFEHPQNR